MALLPFASYLAPLAWAALVTGQLLDASCSDGQCVERPSDESSLLMLRRDARFSNSVAKGSEDVAGQVPCGEASTSQPPNPDYGVFEDQCCENLEGPGCEGKLPVGCAAGGLPQRCRYCFRPGSALNDGSLPVCSQPLPPIPPPLPPSDHLWPRRGLQQLRCQGAGAMQYVESREKCQDLAEQNNHAFYSFLKGEYAGKSFCHTTDSCDMEPMNSSWAVYERPPPGRKYCLVFENRNVTYGIREGSWDEVMDRWEELVQPTPNKVIFDLSTGFEQHRAVTPSFRWKMMVEFREWCGLTSPDDLLPQNTIYCAGGPENRSIRTTPRMTESDYDAVAAQVRGSFAKLPERCNEFSCPQSEYAGCVLRMAGHDFMDFKDDSGGSDGCTNLDAEDNAGLADCLFSGEVYGNVSVSIADDYQRFCRSISIADFLIIAAESLMFELRPPSQRGDLQFKRNFKYGRTTATSCPGAGDHLPLADEGCDDVERVFIQNMRLSRAEAAALSGVHTLGRARVEHSGFSGTWSDKENSRIFNNNYFVSMLAKGWMPKEIRSSGKMQWGRSDEVGPGEDPFDHQMEMMLNSDLCLAYKTSDGQNLDAREHNCCAWMASFKNGDGLDPQVVENNGGLHCGTDRFIGVGSPGQFRCCGNDDVVDCGSVFFPQGIAFDHVHEFAKDEAAWLSVFQQAWTKAIENGFPDLKPLRQQ